MPQSKEPKGRKAKEQPDERSRRRGSSPQGPESRPDVTQEVQRAREALTAGPPGQSTFERHAALIGDVRMSQLSNTLHRAMIVRQLQRDYGNRYVQRLIAHISRKRAEAVQTKLTVGPAGDKYEQEADSVAKEVMGKLASPNAEAPQRQGEEDEELQMKRGAAQRQEEEELDMKPVAQRRIPAEGRDVDRELESTVQQPKGGQALLAPELTHVVQQGGPVVQNAPEKEAGSPVIQSPGNGIRREVLQRAFEPDKYKKTFNKYTKKEIDKFQPVDWITDKSLRPILEAYAQATFVVENVKFLTEVYKFQSGGNVKKLTAIRNTYIKEGSDWEINIPDKLRAKYDGDLNALYAAEGKDVLVQPRKEAEISVKYDNLPKLIEAAGPYLDKGLGGSAGMLAGPGKKEENAIKGTLGSIGL